MLSSGYIYNTATTLARHSCETNTRHYTLRRAARNQEQEVKVIWQKAPHGGPIPRLGVTPGGRKLYHWIPGVGFPISGTVQSVNAVSVAVDRDVEAATGSAECDMTTTTTSDDTILAAYDTNRIHDGDC